MASKRVQDSINGMAMTQYELALSELEAENPVFKRLRTCTAEVAETANFWILRSHNTIVAVTSKDTGVCYDVLRIVYGYTATSAQHIAKFRHDYKTIEYKWSAPHWIAR